MALHTFCGVLTLQVGVALLAIIVWTIAWLTFMVNVFDFYDSEGSFAIHTVTISFFVMLLIFAGCIAFLTAYLESQKLCMAGVAIMVLILVVWILLSSISFLNEINLLKYVCVNQLRCPETFWLAPLRYRAPEQVVEDWDIVPETYVEDIITPSSTPSTTEDEENENRRRRAPPLQKLNSDLDDIENSDAFSPTFLFRRSGYILDFPLVGAVFLFVCNLLFFLFTILIMWSYGQELNWSDRYIQATPSYSSV